MRPAIWYILVGISIWYRLDTVHGALDDEDIAVDPTILITPCILKLSEKYFTSKIRTQGSLAIVNIKPDASLFQRNILNALNENPSHELAVMVKDGSKKHWNASHVTEKAKNYFMLLNDKSEMTAIIKQLRALPTWNPLAQVLVFFLRAMHQTELDEQTVSVLMELFRSSVLNVNVMSQRMNTSIIQVVTWFPYEHTGCAHNFTTLRLLDECEYLPDDAANGGAVSSVDVDDDDVVNNDAMFHESHYHVDWQKIPDVFHDCELRIAATKWEPYTHYKEGEGFYKGIEYFMIKEAAQQMKFNPQFVLIDQREMNYFGSNENGKLFYQKILNGYASVSLPVQLCGILI